MKKISLSLSLLFISPIAFQAQAMEKEKKSKQEAEDLVKVVITRTTKDASTQTDAVDPEMHLVKPARSEAELQNEKNLSYWKGWGTASALIAIVQGGYDLWKWNKRK